MDYQLLKPIVSATTWMILWYGFICKPILRLAKNWHISWFILFIMLVSFSWGWIVGALMDIVAKL